MDIAPARRRLHPLQILWQVHRGPEWVRVGGATHRAFIRESREWSQEAILLARGLHGFERLAALPVSATRTAELPRMTHSQSSHFLDALRWAEQHMVTYINTLEAEEAA